MFKLFGKLKPIHWFWMVIIVGLVICQVYFDVTIPSFTETILEYIGTPLWSDATRIAKIWHIGFKLLGYIFGSMASMIIVSYLACYIAASLSTIIRKEQFQKVLSFSLEELNKFSTASLITRISNDITQVQTALVLFLRLAITAPVTVIWAVIKIQSVNLSLTLAAGAWLFAMIASMLILFMLAYPKFKKIQKSNDRLNSVSRENISGLRVVKAYNADSYEENKFEEVNSGITKLNTYVNRVLGGFMPIMYFVMNGLTLTIYWFGANIMHNDLSNAVTLNYQLPMFVQYIMQIVISFLLLSMLFIMIPRASVSAKRILEVLNIDISISDKEDIQDQVFEQTGTIEFSNVGFKYPQAEENVLSNLNFKIEKGETFAIIGSTGAGKSTLINLIPRFYDATDGNIFIDGVNIKDIKLDVLRSKIGYVPQKGVLFSGTVFDNINFGKNAKTEDTKKYVQVACASEFIDKMENGYDSHISQGGKNVSGGQRQRLSIARAIAVKPEIFIFDDSFSALDYKTDKTVRKNLKDFTKNATNIIVGQRVGSIMDADKILVLDNGKAVGIGTHKELIKNCQVYREIAFSQLTKEELGL